MNRDFQFQQVITGFIVSLALMVLSMPGLASVADLSVTDYQRVSKARVGRSNYDYVYTITLSNTAGPLENVVATVVSSSSRTVILDGEVVFGSIGSGDTPSSATFSFRQNRRYVFNPNALTWSFTGDEPQAAAPPTITSTPLTSSAVNQAYSYGVTATDPNPGDTLAAACHWICRCRHHRHRFHRPDGSADFSDPGEQW